ncbi:MAG TPA: Flp pilus assembly protein CpaB [Baekduia sp.]|uniref:Flp pilus assembly protein CpaB n=1 Tax=Baekduia sp. TaxID=2600305 RepID=UPI002D063C17|nr:Flp pilus assembly protein CpaB [Baekduia sp.]HMJ34048.1 Flp pilus assembly protein CpaB [Baekduia sp.]
MTRRRRAALLLGLALVLGALAASDVAGREAALRRSVGPAVPVVVARTRLAAGTRLDARYLGIRRVPARFAPAAAYASVAALAGTRAAVALELGQDVTPSAVDDGTRVAGAPVRPGERVADVVARGSIELVRPGGRVDVLVTRERGDGGGSTSVALEDAEVLAAGPAAEAGAEEGGPRVAVSLRVTVRQAVFLAAAQSFARELRLLPRAAGDHRRGVAGTTVGADLR